MALSLKTLSRMGRAAHATLEERLDMLGPSTSPLEKLLEEERELLIHLFSIDPPSVEWYEDDDNIPEFGSTGQRIELIRARISNLENEQIQIPEATEIDLGDPEEEPEWMLDSDLGESPTETRSQMLGF